jgi:hypothetical protein
MTLWTQRFEKDTLPQFSVKETSTPKMEAVCSFETSVATCQTSACHNPGERDIQITTFWYFRSPKFNCLVVTAYLRHLADTMPVRG